jgi:predicted AAA+ superfamily ATPase
LTFKKTNVIFFLGGIIKIERPEYLNQLIRFKDKDLIKIIMGIRRCGKSTLFDLYIEYLLNSGIDKKQIIRINLEEYEFADMENYKQLYEYINEKLIRDKNNYVFIDEVQKIKEFQKACDSLYIKKNVDLYITGSNSKLLSGELATLLSGRYIEIKMLPLSFKEYISYVGDSEREKNI